MSILSKLFGLGAAAPAPAAPAKSIDHRGFAIQATPFEERGRWQVCGVIAQTIDGVAREERFIRADAAASRDDAVELTLFKARQIIDLRLGDPAP